MFDAHPELLGVGIDESTAIPARGDRFEMIGAATVAVYDENYKAGADRKRCYVLSPGDWFDLADRRKIAAC